MKPECEGCRQEQAEGFSSIFGQEMTEELLYNLFNRQSSKGSTSRRMDLNQLVRKHLDAVKPEGAEEDTQDLQGWAQSRESNWMQEYSKMKEAKAMAWKELLDRLKSGDIQPSDLSAEQLMQNFLTLVIEGLTSEGLLDLELYRHWMYPNIYIAHPEFSEKSEKVIAKKVLEEAFASLRKASWGSHEVKETGYGDYPSHILREYDDYLHTFDMLDIQETLLATAIRDPEELEILEQDLKARIPIHKSKSANVILVDSSYSMRGDKFRGGIMAALALRELLQTEFKEDTLQVIAYNQKPQALRSGQVIRLKPYGYTDIGQAIDASMEVLEREDGNKNIFLITDGEPTASIYRDQTPEESTLRAAYIAGKRDIGLSIIMLDKRPELKRICEKMARLNGNSVLTYVENPFNLKEFIIRTFMSSKREYYVR
ncbi:MAG: VWA domain-containing protein [Candidatus Bathyarchaeia archaeon]